MKSVWDYFADREREFGKYSLRVENPLSMFAAEEDEQRGQVYGHAFFDGYPETVFLSVFEEVEVVGSGCTRPRYAYFLMIDGQEIGGFERHVTHVPPVHKHCSSHVIHERLPCRAMSFKDAAVEAWRYVSALATP